LLAVVAKKKSINVIFTKVFSNHRYFPPKIPQNFTSIVASLTKLH